MSATAGEDFSAESVASRQGTRGPLVLCKVGCECRRVMSYRGTALETLSLQGGGGGRRVGMLHARSAHE